MIRDGFIDAVEQCLYVAIARKNKFTGYDLDASGITANANDAIDEINYRFQENRFGYTFVRESGQMIQIDSEFLHKEVVEKAFSLLQRSGFEGPEQEFHEAHKKYREEQYKDAIVDASKAF